MNARDGILSAVRRGLTRGIQGTLPRHHPDRIRADAAALLHELDMIRPDLSGPDLTLSFIDKCANPALGVTLTHLYDWSALSAAVAAYCDHHKLPRRLAVGHDQRLADLSETGIETYSDAAPDELTAISIAEWGIAETGSVVIHSSDRQPILNAMLPKHWLVVLDQARILPFLDDYATMEILPPRNAILITGSSGTTDIEGVFVRGAHGPGFVHILLIGKEHNLQENVE